MDGEKQPGRELTAEEFEKRLLEPDAKSRDFDRLAQIKEVTAGLASAVEPFPSEEEHQRKYYMDSFNLLVRDIPGQGKKIPGDERAHLYHLREFLSREVMWAYERDGSYFRVPGQRKSRFLLAMTRPGHPDVPQNSFIASKEQMELVNVITDDVKFLEDGRPVKVSDILLLSPEAVTRQWAAIILAGGLTMLEVLPSIRDIDRHGLEDEMESMVTALIVWGDMAAANHLSRGRLGPALQSVIKRYDLHSPREIGSLAKPGPVSGEIARTLETAMGDTAALSALERMVRGKKYASFLLFAQKFPQLDAFNAILAIKEKLSRQGNTWTCERHI